MNDGTTTQELVFKLDRFMKDTTLHQSLPFNLVSRSMGTDTSRIFNMIEQLIRTESFYQILCRYIEKEGFSDVKFYTESAIGAATFSNIKKPGYQPSKDTVFKSMLTLKLDFVDASVLLEKSGYSFVWTEPKDLVVIFCIMNEIYQQGLIDGLLAAQNLRTLFSIE